MLDADVKVTSVVVDSIEPAMTIAEEEQKIKEKNLNDIADIAKNMQETINNFSDQVPVDDEESSKEPKNSKEAEKFLSGLNDFIGSDNFKNKVNLMSQKYKIPPKQIAKNFLTKSLGIIGDILGISISTVGNVVHTFVSLISTILHSGVDLICKVANALARVFTLNQTNQKSFD